MNKKIDFGSLYRRLFDAYSVAYADKKKPYKKKLTTHGKD